MRRFRTSLLFPTLLWGGLLTATATAADLLDLPFQDLLQVEIRSAGKREEPIRDIPASVTIVTREEIARYGWQTFEELLRHVPGFYLLTNTEDRFIGTRGTVGGGVQVACARGRLNHCYAVHNNSYSPDSSRTPTWPSIHRDAERSRTAVAIARKQSSTRSFSGIWRPTLPWQGKMTGTASGCRPTSNGRFGVISNAASSPTGRLSQTKWASYVSCG